MPFSVTTVLSREIWNAVFDELGVSDIFRLARACRTLQVYTEAYWDSMIRLSRILKNYITTDDQVEEFRMMMKTTGTIISGSSALQAFARANYDASDLDLYTEEASWNAVATFLISLGYEKLEKNRGTKEALDPDDGYPGHTEIKQVVTYEGTKTGKIIQLIITSREPVYAVLQFHSTCVMNIITHANAICLYPYFTLCEKRALVCGPTTVKIVEALEKYKQRGWDVNSFMTVDMMISHLASEINVRSRRMADQLCWKRRLVSNDKEQKGDLTVHDCKFKWRITFQKFRSYDNVHAGTTWPLEWNFSGRLVMMNDD